VSSNETDLLFPENLRIVRAARAANVSLEAGANIEGLLEEREGLCLYVLAWRAATLGDVVEIGSWKGRSTWYLARALEDVGSRFRVVAVDPHLEDTAEAFSANIARSGLAARIDPRSGYSHDVARAFDRPVGMLWIDGDHSYRGVREDFEDWFPKLAVGGWIAFHDTVNHWYGPTRLVRELLMSRNDLRRIGVMGMITYAQKSRPRSVNHARALTARVSFEAVTLLRSTRVGWGPRNLAPGEP
jgi:predicted O-methyltransferase YrrM